MTPAETIAAAIEKLERERTASNPYGEAWRANDRITGDYSEIRATSPSGVTTTLATELTAEDAVLIVTLHRTIDAQLAILRAAARARVRFEEAEALLLIDEAALDLARAILGEDA